MYDENISVVIITKNEAHNIRRCLESVKWADEIVIYDTGSTDETIKICKEYNCSIYHQKAWDGFGQAKHEAVNLAKHNWIFSIDADEEVTEKLKAKILSADPSKAFRIKRVSFYMGKIVKYSGWQRDYTLRLFNRKTANFNLKKVHESVVTNGEVGVIDEVLYHYTYPYIKTHITKMISYCEIGANEAFKKDKKYSILRAILSAIGKFIKMYLLNLGFLDGKVGLVLAINSSFGLYLKYIYLWEMKRG